MSLASGNKRRRVELRAGCVPGRTRSELARVGLGCAVALSAVLACSREDPEAPARPTEAIEATRPIDGVHERDASAPGATLVPKARPAAAPGADVEVRIGEILDTEPVGDGLDALIRVAEEGSDPRVREAAVVALGDSDDPRALDALIAATEDTDPQVVLAAVEALRWSDDRLAEDALARLVDSPSPEIAAAAREGLGE